MAFGIKELIKYSNYYESMAFKDMLTFYINLVMSLWWNWQEVIVLVCRDNHRDDGYIGVYFIYTDVFRMT